MPTLAGPALLGRRARVLCAAAAGVFVLGYLPHLAAVGTAVLGYLPGYLREEGYGSTERFGALRLLVPDSAAAAVAVTFLAATAPWR